MEAYSLDLRERVCAACDEHLETRGEVAERFGVSRSFLQKLLRRRHQSGSIVPDPRRCSGPAPKISEQDRRRLRELLKAKPDATLAELCRSLREAGGAQVSVPTMCRALRLLRLPLKKRRCTRANVTPRGSGRCVGTSGGGSGRSIRDDWWSWMRAGSTPR